MRIKNPFADLTGFERMLWLGSVLVIVVSCLLSGGGDWLSVVASVIGVTALIFVAKGYVLGQVLTVVFAGFYGTISFFFRYYGEMLTYLGMTAPMAVVSAISWLRNPYAGTKEVAVHRLTRGQFFWMVVMSAVSTAVFYVLLRTLGNANLLFSTISVTTSFVAAYLTCCRSPYYALGYGTNDVVLIVLWILATMEDRRYLPMVVCFVMFLVNDLYGFWNWQRMARRQTG
ncbi:MAG: nicotinamide mononucleotide transporter [Ruminococcaceae bacterium]|nr:nicotinamide mononucleotide transporter [Oscillospiraceae bacterium]